MLLAFSGVVGLWGIGFFSYDLLRPVLDKAFRAQGLTGAALAGKTGTWIGITSLLQNLGCFFGVYAFTYLTHYTGRKKAFAVSFVAAMLATAFTFWKLKELSQIFWMIPLMGFAQLSLFGGYAIYLPELFPTRLRSTGTSFCYNVGRLAAAGGPLTLGLLTSRVFAGHAEPMRYAGVTMCLVFLVGLAALPFAPETKGQPLPE
jgi:MFS-type transporter involved in bile tolerance (Atg22 family)